MTDMVNKPAHYSDGLVECIDGIQSALSAEEFRGFLKGTAMRYVWRAGKKFDGVEDIEKAQVYLGWMHCDRWAPHIIKDGSLAGVRELLGRECTLSRAQQAQVSDELLRLAENSPATLTLDTSYQFILDQMRLSKSFDCTNLTIGLLWGMLDTPATDAQLIALLEGGDRLTDEQVADVSRSICSFRNPPDTGPLWRQIVGTHKFQRRENKDVAGLLRRLLDPTPHIIKDDTPSGASTNRDYELKALLGGVYTLSEAVQAEISERILMTVPGDSVSWRDAARVRILKQLNDTKHFAPTQHPTLLGIWANL